MEIIVQLADVTDARSIRKAPLDRCNHTIVFEGYGLSDPETCESVPAGQLLAT